MQEKPEPAQDETQRNPQTKGTMMQLAGVASIQLDELIAFCLGN
jgi:hypothetical protein